MARRPPQRPTPTDTIGATSVADSATDRALSDIRDLLGRMQTKIAANQAAIETVAAAVDDIDTGGGGSGDTYGDREYVIPLIDVTVALGSIGAPGDGFVNISTTANNTQLVFGPLPMLVGERAKSCTARVNKNSLGTMTLRFQRSADGTARSDIGTSATSSTNGLQTLTSTVATPTELVAYDNYYVTITCPNSGDNVHWVTYTVDKVV